MIDIVEVVLLLLRFFGDERGEDNDAAVSSSTLMDLDFRG